MKIGFVRIFVTELKRSLDFYEKTLGLEIDFTDHSNWAQFNSGEDISLAIEQCDENHLEQGAKVVGRFTGITLMADDLDSEFDRLRTAGVMFTGTPERQPWGGRQVHFKDPDANILTLIQESDLV